MSFLTLENVGLTYTSRSEHIEAIQDINLCIERQSFVCLLGPSGCGKSTLLKIIAGYLKPTCGEVCLEGKVIDGPDRDRGVVFQTPMLYPWLNVQENISFGLRMRGIDQKRQREVAQSYLRQIDMEEFSEVASFELSGGMKQRVALARVLANEPDIILMDEPFGALDALTRQNMQGMMRRLRKQNESTVFMITHDVDEALSLSDRVFVMSASPGTIEEDIRVDFAEKALEKNQKFVEQSSAYLEMKNHILSTIME